MLECGGSHAASSAAAAGGGCGGTSSSSSSSAFYGSGETFLYALADLSLPQLPEQQLSTPSPAGIARGVSRTVTYTYSWCRDGNDHFVRSHPSGLYFGSGGVAGVGLRLDPELRTGLSGQCATFDNAPLPSVATPLGAYAAFEAEMAASSPSPQPSPLPPRRSDALRAGQAGGEAAAIVTPPPVSRAAPSTGDFAPPGAGIRFNIASVEVWALDERACRAIPACAKLPPVPLHETLPTET